MSEKLREDDMNEKLLDLYIDLKYAELDSRGRNLPQVGWFFNKWTWKAIEQAFGSVVPTIKSHHIQCEEPRGGSCSCDRLGAGLDETL